MMCRCDRYCDAADSGSGGGSSRSGYSPIVDQPRITPTLSPDNDTALLRP